MQDKERVKRKHAKELKSLRNKLNISNKAWFDSLPSNKQYDILYNWKSMKYHRSSMDKPEVSYYRIYGEIGYKKHISYPPKLKHFIKEMKKHPRFKGDISKIRKNIINNFL
jgi:hypothetical protein